MRAHFIGVVVIPMLLLAACGNIRVGGERSVSDENDRLRMLVHEQEDHIKTLEGEPVRRLVGSASAG